MKHPINVLPVILLAFLMVLGGGPGQPREPQSHQGKKVHYVGASELLNEFRNGNESKFEEKLLKIGIQTLDKITEHPDEVELAVNTSYFNSNNKKKLSNPSFIICKFKETERTKLSRLKNTRTLSFVGGLDKVINPSNIPLILDCEFIFD